MLKVRTMEYIHIDDICEMFDCNIREFSFVEDRENGSFFYLPCDESWIQDTVDCMEDMAGTRYEKKYYNTLRLQEYVRDVMKQEGIEVYISW